MVRIDPALIFLTRLRASAKLRQALKSLKTVRGLLLAAFGFLMVFFWIVPFFLSVFLNDDLGNVFDFLASADPLLPRTGFSVLLLAFCVAALIFPSKGAPVPFDLAEIDFLFCGPFTRRELLVHKLGVFALRMLPVALLFALFLLLTPWSFIAGVCGVCLSFLMVLLFSTVVGLAGQALASRLVTRTRRLLAFGCLALVGLGAWQGVNTVLATVPSSETMKALDVVALQDWVLGVAESPLVLIVLAPFEPFSRLIASTHPLVDIPLWGSLALLINVLLLAAVLKLDADYYETSIAVSRKMHDNRRRLREGGLAALITANRPRGSAKWSLPDLPRLGGAGVMAWRQSVTAARGMPRLLVYGFPVLVIILTAVSVSSGLSTGMLGGAALITGIVTVLYFPMLFRFDFRADLDKMESLKVLPIPAWTLAAGQLLTPVLVASIVQIAVLTPCAFAAGRLVVVPGLLLLAPLINALVFAVENIVFLVFPTRVVVAGPGDFQVMARMYLTFFVKSAVLLPCLGVALGPAGLVFWLSDSWIVAALSAALVLTVEIAVAVLCTAWAFDRFDPSTDTPA